MNSAASTDASVSEFFSRKQLTIVVLCALVVVFDGFDTQAIAYVAPRIAQDWGVASALFGPIFSAGLAGLAAGNLLLGPLADRFGRKVIILAAVAVFGTFALATAFSTGMGELLAFRFITGLGLGAAMPNVIALTSEYAPTRYRATAVMVMFCGFPLGAVLGGLVAGPLMAEWGWQAVFIVGGVLPLILLPLLYAAMPESARFLATRSGNEGRIARILRQIQSRQTADQFIAAVRSEQGDAARLFSVAQLFSGKLAVSTLLLWAAFFSNLLVMYFLVNWLPTLIEQAGLPPRIGILSVAIMNLAGSLAHWRCRACSTWAIPTGCWQLPMPLRRSSLLFSHPSGRAVMSCWSPPRWRVSASSVGRSVAMPSRPRSIPLQSAPLASVGRLASAGWARSSARWSVAGCWPPAGRHSRSS